MNTIKSDLSNSTITTDYDQESNTIDISIGNKDGFRFVNLNSEKAEHLLDLLTEFKSMLI